MNEKEILASIRSECDQAAPDDFKSIIRKVNKPKQSINVLIKIAAAAAIFILPVASVYISSRLNSIDHNTITIAEITQNTDKTSQPSSTYSQTSTVSKSAASSSNAVLTVTDQTENSDKTAPISKAPSISSGIINGVITATPEIIPGHISTNPVINSTTSSAPQITQNVPSVSSQAQPDSDVTDSPDDSPTDMEVPTITDDKVVPTVTQVDQTGPCTTDCPFPETLVKSFRLICPESFPEIINKSIIIKGTQYYYEVDNYQYYTVAIEYFDNSTKMFTLSEALDEKYVSIEQLIVAGLPAKITDTVK